MSCDITSFLIFLCLIYLNELIITSSRAALVAECVCPRQLNLVLPLRYKGNPTVRFDRLIVLPEQAGGIPMFYPSVKGVNWKSCMTC